MFSLARNRFVGIKEGHNTRIFLLYLISHKVCDVILWI